MVSYLTFNYLHLWSLYIFFSLHALNRQKKWCLCHGWLHGRNGLRNLTSKTWHQSCQKSCGVFDRVRLWSNPCKKNIRSTCCCHVLNLSKWRNLVDQFSLCLQTLQRKRNFLLAFLLCLKPGPKSRNQIHTPICWRIQHKGQRNLRAHGYAPDRW